MVSFIQSTHQANADHLLTAAQSAAIDKRAIELGISGEALMEEAGLAAAELITDYIGTPLEAGGPIIVLCGPGNNGGDGFVLARHLDEWGYPVHVRCMVPIKNLSGDAALAATKWRGKVGEMSSQGFEASAAIIDCLFGTGLNKPIGGDLIPIVEAANNAGAFILAVDIPSGLSADTGQAIGPCIHADATITFNTKKPGQVIAPGRFLCGGNENIHCVQLSIPDHALDLEEVNTFENNPALWGAAYRFCGPQSHKYNRGHMVVLGGREPTLGASRLASLAGLRAGAGLVTLAAPAETYPIQAAALMDVMVRRFDSAFGFMGILADKRIMSVLIGPGAGLGEKTVELVRDVGTKNKALVLDADALTSLVDRVDLIKQIKSDDVVLTPHEGEFARLFPGIEFEKDRISAAREAARQTQATIVLKGVSTVVASPDGRVSIATNAPSWLSVGGTGDVLSGIIGGLIAQGMPAFEAASAGVWIHGEAGMKAGRGMIASDLLPGISKALP